MLLIQSVDHLGKQETSSRSAGYARNCCSSGLATIATNHYKRMVEKHRTSCSKLKSSGCRVSGRWPICWASKSITIEANANDEGHLYGSVGPGDIVAELKKAGFNVTNDQVRLEGLPKELGLYTVRIHLHSDIEAELKVWVVP
ncbi:MAG: 50S ribosomal protein L9 [Pirellulales bacterium]